MRDKISACLTVGNEEANIRRCLESLHWVDEIVVVDSFSQDRTVEICREYTERVYQHAWLGYVGQKELIKQMASHPWLFFVDADEEVSPELRDEILAEFNSGRNRKVAAYKFPRKVFFLGKWITHGEWWPDIKIRLFLKDRGICTGQEPHDYVAVQGPVKKLNGCLFHYTYDDLSDQIATLNRFSSISAASMHKNGRRFSILDLIFRPLFRFLKGYFLKRGFCSGIRGLIISTLTATGVFLKYAKLWELSHAPEGAQTIKDGTLLQSSPPSDNPQNNPG
ncbi:MAG: glycosyltransferase family 2 protein [Kiritimatiellia bacterium]|jgi:glycosyltransferase involved in cell wall biosynthesis